MNEASVKVEKSNRPQLGPSRALRVAILALVVVLSMLVATGCGKPDFCEDRTALEKSVKALPNAATSGGVSGLETQLKTVKSDADTLVASAKSDFPNEAGAIETSLDQFESSVKALPPDPTTSQFAAIAINASAVVSAVQAFMTATNEECK